MIICDSNRANYLHSIGERIKWDVKRLKAIIGRLDNKRNQYTADDVIIEFKESANRQSLFNFMQGVIAQLQQMGKQRTSETYRCTLKSFMQFREDKDVLLNAMYLINRKLKEIGKIVSVQLPLTMYVARHSWASVAKNKNVPISVISEGMGQTRFGNDNANLFGIT